MTNDKMKEFLQPINDAKQSFYKKAVVIKDKNTITLESYGIEVCKIKKKELIHLDKRHSSTTNRHIKEFLTQNKVTIIINK